MTFVQFDTAFEDEVFPFASHRAGNRLGVVIDHLFALGGITAQASVAHSAFGLVDRLNRSQVHRQVGVVIRIQGLAGLVVFPVLLDVNLAGITDHGAVLSGEQRVENLHFTIAQLHEMRHAFQVGGNGHVHHDLFAHRFGDEAAATGQHSAGSGGGQQSQFFYRWISQLIKNPVARYQRLATHRRLTVLLSFAKCIFKRIYPCLTI